MMSQGDQPTILQESAEPGVIDQEMLIALVIDQGPKGEAGRLFLEDGISLSDVTEIRIEFLNILNIDHLWIMHNLVKLKLCNNIIEKIENLDVLIHLKELDLSFNHIQVMENLNHLNSLEILLLYENEISIIEGIEELKELMIFSIGNNNIENWNHVMYLRKFKRLRSLNMAGNPCVEEEGYLEYLYAYVPQLVYLQYKMITDEERRAAVEKNYRDICNLEEHEAKEQEEINATEAFEANVLLFSKSYVEYLDGDYLFKQMFARDKEGNDMLTINEEAQQAFEEYALTFSAICMQLFELGLKEQIRRTEEIKKFDDIVNAGKDDTQKEAQILMDEIMERKSEIFTDVRQLMESMTEEMEAEVLDEKLEKAQRLSEEFSDLVARTWTKLMYREVVLHEQMEDINEVFKLNMTDMVGAFLEQARGFFAQLRNAETEYNDNITLIANLFMNGFLVNEESKMPVNFVEICGDKDILSNNLAASHDLHLQIIDAREDLMLSRLKEWLDEYVEKQMQEEIDRNRRQVLEISHFLESQREEFESLQLYHQLNAGNTDPDIAAALEG